VRYDLAAAEEVARLVDSAGGAIAGDLLAPALGYSSPNNGAYLTRVANARLFGLVTGRSSRFELTARGRGILAGVEPDVSAFRDEAFLAVPLFRAVAEQVGKTEGNLPGDVAQWLVDDFGEVAGKADITADRLIASAGQAGLLSRRYGGNYQLKTSLTHFTSVDKLPSPWSVPHLRSLRSTRTRPREVVTMGETGLWLDEESSPPPKSVPAWRRVGVVAVAAAVLVVVGVPVALVATGSPSKPVANRQGGSRPVLGTGPAEHQVISALSATTDSGNFDFSYTLSSTGASSTAPTTTSTTTCHDVTVPVPINGSGAISGSNGGGFVSGGGVIVPTTVSGGAPGPTTTPPGLQPTVSPTLPPGLTWGTQRVCSGQVVNQASPPVTGSGVINTNPMAMVASASIGGGLDVTVRVDGNNVYEGASNDTGLAPLASDTATGGSNSGSTLPGFAGITEGTLGNREGAVAMMGMASPSGYLDLFQPAISAAAQSGTGSVGGAPVTVYQVSNDPTQLANAPGTTTAESQTISAALALLKAQGYTSNTVQVSIDGAGFIRQVKTTDSFSDGGTVTLEGTFSNFGCAGTVLMPGQTGAGTPPSGCASPDSPSASTNLPSTAPTHGATSPTSPSTGSSNTTTATTSAAPPTAPASQPGCASGNTSFTMTTDSASTCVKVGAKLTVTFVSLGWFGGYGHWHDTPPTISDNSVLAGVSYGLSGNRATAVFNAVGTGKATVVAQYDVTCAPAETTPCTVPPEAFETLTVTVDPA
jgi:hypothetical protein